MDLKSTLRAITLELRRELEGKYDTQGNWQPGDLERRLAAIGVRRDRSPVPVDELAHLSADDREARRVADAFIQSRAEAGQDREGAVADFVRAAAYSWANRLLALRCMEARSLIEEVILQKDAYGGRSLQHQRLARKEPERCSGEDEGLLTVLFDEFGLRAKELPLLFDPKAAEVTLRPSIAALKRCIALLSGTIAAKGQGAATDEVFTAPDALGWTYQYWNMEEKERVFEKVRTTKGAKIEGAEIVSATCIYTEPYMVKFLVQNSLGAMWMGMNPRSRLCQSWEYYVCGADRAFVSRKSVAEITFLDPACGSGHFLIEAFELFYAMYLEEGDITDSARICAAILERNLYGIDIDERAVQIAAVALLMKAKEKAPNFVPGQVNLVATNIRLPAGKKHLEAFLRKHPEDAPLRPALLAIFEGLANADELGSLLQIEEPVEQELRHLREQQFEGDHKAAAGSLFGPRSEEQWGAWKHEAIERLRQHFAAEAQETDLATAFFGGAASKGLSLADLLARRFDIVAANPPYMGSKNLGPVLKRYVTRHFVAGKRDLFAAFILRCAGLASEGGRVAMVTPESWMSGRSYADLRALDASTGEPSTTIAGGLLRNTSIEVFAQLGRHAFSEADPPSNVVLVAFALESPSEPHRIRCFRVTASMPSEEQAALLRRAVAGNAKNVCYAPVQKRFLDIPQAPLSYWLRDHYFDLLAGRTISSLAAVCQGLATADDSRFVRFVWEVPIANWSRATASRWLPYEKGGGYGKWFGHHFWAVDWEHNGSRIKAFPPSVIRNEQHYFKGGWTYSHVARGSLALRILDDRSVFSEPAIFGLPDAAVGCCNSAVASFLVRSISQSIAIRESYVARLPVPVELPDSLQQIVHANVSLKRFLTARDPTERSFSGIGAIDQSSLTRSAQSAIERSNAIAMFLHSLEGISQQMSATLFGVEADDLQAVVFETGTPVGWHPLLQEYDAPPEAPEYLQLRPGLLDSVAQASRQALAPHELVALKKRLRNLYEAGPGAADVTTEFERTPSDDAEDEDDSVVGARIPVPAETFLEELGQKINVHPISVLRLLEELVDREGASCRPEFCRFAENYVSVLVLRLLGHRWPREIESSEIPPGWAGRNGIIPFTERVEAASLLARVRERLADDFSPDLVHAIEREFQEIVGKSLDEWLSVEFFKRHISQFKKRPIAWQIASQPDIPNGQRGGTRSRALRGPAFACLLYYHQLDADLLPKLRSHYLRGLRTAYETELRTLERLSQPIADQATRKTVLEIRLEEMQRFDARLQAAADTGFGPDLLRPRLHQLAVDEAMLAMKARWLARLRDTLEAGPLGDWRDAAADLGHHEGFPRWITEAINHLPRHCAKVGAGAPNVDVLLEDPTPGTLAPIICAEAAAMTRGALTLACARWRRDFDAHVIEPLRSRIAAANESLEHLTAELDALESTATRRREVIAQRQTRLRSKVKGLKREINEKTQDAEGLSSRICKWTSPVLETWEPWLANSSLFDEFSSFDGRRAVPVTIRDFVRQESFYAPDLNDGVRVNIAPLQRAGLLTADVLDPKDMERAIADRAEWRAEERRWCHEGRLPAPGWWAVPVEQPEALPVLPDTIPSLVPLQEAAVVVCALVRVSGGTMARLELARAFALRSQPHVLLKLAPASLRDAAEAWAKRVSGRKLPVGLLAKAISDLVDREGIGLELDSGSRLLVTVTGHTPAEGKLDPLFLFEARLAVRVLADLSPHDVGEVDASISGEDWKFINAEAA